MVAAAAACGKLGSDLNQVIAISTAAPDSLEEYDTLRSCSPSSSRSCLRAVALNGSGDSVPGTIFWASLDSVLTVLNDTSGETVVDSVRRTGRLQARVGNLYSSPISIRTLAAADRLFATGPTVDTVTLSAATPPDSLSGPLDVELVDTVATASATDSIPLAGRPVVYAITYATTPDSVTLVTSDTVHTPVAVDTVATNSLGAAFVKVRLLGGPLPDSVVVTASARRAVGDTVPGSPVTFVLRFQR